MQTQMFAITEKLLYIMTTLELIALFGAGVLLLTMIRTVRRVVQPNEKKDHHRGVTGVVTACVLHCVQSTIHFLLVGQRVASQNSSFA